MSFFKKWSNVVNLLIIALPTPHPTTLVTNHQTRRPRLASCSRRRYGSGHQLSSQGGQLAGLVPGMFHTTRSNVPRGVNFFFGGVCRFDLGGYSRFAGLPVWAIPIWNLDETRYFIKLNGTHRLQGGVSEALRWLQAETGRDVAWLAEREVRSTKLYVRAVVVVSQHLSHFLSGRLRELRS